MNRGLPQRPPRPHTIPRVGWVIGGLCLLLPAVVFAAEPTEYRSLFGLEPRTIVWVVAQLHLLFGAFVLGVPIFAVIVELVGALGGEARYDRLAHEFAKLLFAAFSTTAALGGTMAFLLVGLYPGFMARLGQALHGSFYVYCGLFFAEAFSLYLYYYLWDRLRGRGSNQPRLRRPLWGLALLAGVAAIGVAIWGPSLRPVRAQGEATAAAIGAVAEGLAEDVKAAVEEEEVGPRASGEAIWQARVAERVEAALGAIDSEDRAQLTPHYEAAGVALVALTVETLKTAKKDRVADRFEWATRKAAASAKLTAQNAASDLSAAHWARVGWVGLGFLILLGLACWSTSDKSLHLYLGLVLNLAGTALMMVVNSWATYMMSPTGINEATLRFGGTTWGAVTNPLWQPLNLHRLLANVVFGGFVAAAYAAVKFLGAKSDEARAHYDWMGYVGNFVGMLALITLPFAGYILGREMYSVSPIMGNNMMGGAFSWAFVWQAVLIGVLFLGANYYLWIGMERIPGSERYRKYLGWYALLLLLGFAVWLTPHNLQLSPGERAAMGGVNFHPVLKYFGLMAAKNAVVNLIILTTFFCFIMYRRANKGAPRPFFEVNGKGAAAVLLGVTGLVVLRLGSLALRYGAMDPREISVPWAAKWVIEWTGWSLWLGVLAAGLAIGLTLANRGRLGQAILLGVTGLLSVIFLGVWGFVAMKHANPFLRDIAVCQTWLVGSAILQVGAIDIFLYRKAPVIGAIRWGHLPPLRSQLALVVVTVAVVQLMGLMGYIRSAVREDWHIYGVMRDTSAGAATPSLAYVGWVVAFITLAFFALAGFVFWLSTLGDREPGPTQPESEA